jgi:hypothetical protein
MYKSVLVQKIKASYCLYEEVKGFVFGQEAFLVSISDNKEEISLLNVL